MDHLRGRTLEPMAPIDDGRQQCPWFWDERMVITPLIMQFRGIMQEASFLGFRILSGWDGRCEFGIVAWPRRPGAVSAVLFSALPFRRMQGRVWTGVVVAPAAVPASPLPVGCMEVPGR